MVSVSPVPEARRRREYWAWAAVALYVLLTVDLLTTMAAAEVAGVGAEANPYMRWALAQGVWTLVALNLAALVVLAGLFWAVIALTTRTGDPYRDVVALAYEVWVGLLIAAGLLVAANNLLVVAVGVDLFI
ncbi:hypothetical protein U3A55_07355 [Salarchaeum sp. III]|uniref:hypothetical protein n=1 Tax=Salarchaeum sp. III TaxID=3107927 RepID=UPI002ED8CF97